jgi:hypothetical protein
MQGQHQSLKEKLIRSKNDNSELREEVDSLSKVKDRQRTLEFQLKVRPSRACNLKALGAAVILQLLGALGAAVSVQMLKVQLLSCSC